MQELALRTLVFVDESNVVSAARMMNRRMDWEALRDHLAEVEPAHRQPSQPSIVLFRHVVEMTVYLGLPPTMSEFSEAREKKEKFVYWLRTHGFLTVVKDGTPTREGKYKSNVDVLMAIDAVDMTVDIKPDEVILVTGDSDFAHLALRLRHRGVNVTVASTEKTVSSELRAAANRYLDLAPVMERWSILRPFEEEDEAMEPDTFD